MFILCMERQLQGKTPGKKLGKSEPETELLQQGAVSLRLKAEQHGAGTVVWQV